MSLMSASKMMNTLGRKKDWAMRQADAQQAYTQSELKYAGAWAFLPRYQWPRGWGGSATTELSGYEWLSTVTLCRERCGRDVAPRSRAFNWA